jgi:hypothetical protein
VLPRKADLVIMMNCWMQMLETGYELAETVNILVAAETVHFFAGYDYTNIINQMARNPRSSANTVAKVAVNTIESNFMEERSWRKHLKEVIISATALSRIKNIKHALDAVCKELNHTLDKKFETVRRVRQGCLDLSSGYFTNTQSRIDKKIVIFFIDFYNYIAELANEGLISSQSLVKLDKAFKKYILYIYIGNKYTEPSRNGIQLGHGVSIFHPFRYNDFDDLYYEYFYLRKRIKMATTSWNTFLDEFKIREKSNVDALAS